MFKIEGILLNMGEDMDEDQLGNLFANFLDENNLNFMGNIVPYTSLSNYDDEIDYDFDEYDEIDYGMEVEDIRELTEAESELYEKLVALQNKTDEWLNFMKECNNNCSHNCQDCAYNSVCDKCNHNSID